MNAIPENPIPSQGELYQQAPKASSFSQQQSHIKSVTPSHGPLEKLPSNTVEGNNKLASIAIVTPEISVPSDAEIKITGGDLRECIEGVTQQLAPYFVPCDEKNASKIFVLDKESKGIELHDNTITAEVSDLAIEASHEMAKERFVSLLKLLYGSVIDDFFPEEKMKEPLTVLEAQIARDQINQFHQRVEAACQGDPSKYEECLKSERAALQKEKAAAKAALEKDETLKPQFDALTTSLSKQLGVAPETIQAYLVTGVALSAVATAAATGVGFVAAFHVIGPSLMSLLSHGAGIGVGLPLLKATSVATTATASVTHSSTMVGTGFARAADGVAAATLVGTGLGALFGLATGSTIVGLDWSRGGQMSLTGLEMTGCVIGGAMTGFWMSFGGALLGPAALNVGVAHPATWGLYGAAFGGTVGSAATGIVAGIERWNAARGANPNDESIMHADQEDSLHSTLHHMFPWSRELSPGAQIALAAAAGGVAGAVITGAEGYLAGGLAQYSAYYAANFTAAVAGGN